MQDILLVKPWSVCLHELITWFWNFYCGITAGQIYSKCNAHSITRFLYYVPQLWNQQTSSSSPSSQPSAGLGRRAHLLLSHFSLRVQASHSPHPQRQQQRFLRFFCSLYYDIDDDDADDVIRHPGRSCVVFLSAALSEEWRAVLLCLVKFLLSSTDVPLFLHIHSSWAFLWKLLPPSHSHKTGKFIAHVDDSGLAS